MKLVARALAIAVATLAALGAASAGCSSSPGSDLHCSPANCSNGATRTLCTKLDSSNTCLGVAYEVGSQAFVCNSCNDCTEAEALSDQVCGAPSGDGGARTADGGEGVRTVDGGGKGQQTCSPRTACGGATSGVTYEECVTVGASGTCVSEGYQTSDGLDFNCNGCDCSAAAQQLSAYCSNPGSSTPVTTCAASSTCGSALTDQLCTTSSGGSCQSMAYQVSDGATYACAGCGNCAAALTQLSTFCASQESATTTCAGAVACGAGGLTYQECTTAKSGACQSVAYDVSNGATYTCAGCGNCSTAQSELDSFCTAQDQPTTTCGAAVTCGTEGATYQFCSTAIPGGGCEEADYEASDGVSYECGSCSDCSSALDAMLTHCAGDTPPTPTTTCTAATACGNGGATYEACTTTTNGVCTAKDYKTTTGDQYSCASCSDCSAALQTLDAYCATQNTPTTSCSTASACGTTGVTSYSCETQLDGDCQTITYETSDGHTFACGACTGCDAEYDAMLAYCKTLGAPPACTLSCSTGASCCTCNGAAECLATGGDPCSAFGCQ